MKNMAAHPYLYRAEEYQQFLKGGGDYQRCACALPPATSRRIITSFCRYFGDPDMDSDETFDSQIESFEKDFKWQLVALKELRKKTKALSDSYFLFQTNLMVFSDKVKEIEPTLRQEDAGFEPWFEYPERIHDFDNPYQRIYSWCTMEKQECAAIYAAISARNGVLTRRKMAISEKESSEKKFRRLCEGKMVLPWQSRNKLKVKYEMRINSVRHMQLEEEIDNLLVIGKIVSRRLVEVELPRFLERRGERYAKLIEEFGDSAATEFEAVLPTQMLKNALIISSKLQVSPSPNVSNFS